MIGGDIVGVEVKLAGVRTADQRDSPVHGPAILHTLSIAEVELDEGPSAIEVGVGVKWVGGRRTGAGGNWSAKRYFEGSDADWRFEINPA
jgi:hypothetical protein